MDEILKQLDNICNSLTNLSTYRMQVTAAQSELLREAVALFNDGVDKLQAFKLLEKEKSNE